MKKCFCSFQVCLLRDIISHSGSLFVEGKIFYFLDKDNCISLLPLKYLHEVLDWPLKKIEEKTTIINDLGCAKVHSNLFLDKQS